MKNIFLYTIFLLLISCYSNKELSTLPTTIENKEMFVDSLTNVGGVIYDKKDTVFIELKTETSLEDEHSLPYKENTIERGTLFYQIDSIFIINTITRVEARIIKNTYDTTPRYVIETFHKTNSGKIKKRIIPVGNIMNMELISLDQTAFTINKISSDNQEISSNVIAEWIWGVTPLKIGNYNLILKAIIKESGVNKDIIVFDKEINVVNKPKNKYLFKFYNNPDIKKYNNNLLVLEINENNDTSNMEWGGGGEIYLEIENETDFEIKKENSYIINSDKNNFTYKWIIKPIGKSKKLNYKIIIKGDYEQLIIKEGDIDIKRNLKYSFNNFVDNTIQRWYYIIFTLLIPAYFWLKKKHFKK